MRIATSYRTASAAAFTRRAAASRQGPLTPAPATTPPDRRVVRF